MPTIRLLRTITIAFSLGLALPVGAAPRLETDPNVRQAERTLRAAELRETDETAMDLYRLAGEQAEAILSRNPNSPGANFVYFAANGRILIADGLTKNLFALRKLDKDHLDRAIQLDPEYANALAAKGGVLLDLPSLVGGDPDEGLRLLRRANQINPSGVGTRVSFARALAHHGQIDEARRQAKLAAHHACMQRRRKALDDAAKLLGELDGAPVAQATLN